jgi:lipopolysaccharide transport system ATP-binding protein
MDERLAIVVEGIGKRYRIGTRVRRDDTIVGALLSYLKKPVRNFKAYRSLYRFEAPGSGPNAGPEAADILWALRDVSFVVRQGESIGIIGRNGAGKSTLLKILSRITDPTAGRAVIRGRVSSLLEVGTGFHPELTGRENIYLNGTILGMKKSEIDRKLDEIVDFSGVERFLDTPVKRYSSGMTVRLAFAVAAHLEPEILIIDEVLAVGDAAFQDKCLGRMNEVTRQGRTVLFVSHNMAAVANLCQRSVLLDNGRVAAVGATNEVVEKYLKGVATLAEQTFDSRSDRQGLRGVSFTQVEFFDAAHRRVECGQTGEDLIVRLHFQCRPNQRFKNCRLGVAIRRKEKNFLVLGTELVDPRSITIERDGWIDFILPRLPLTESTYLVTVFAESGGEIQDWILDAAKLKVIDGDYYGSGRNVPHREWNGDYVLAPFRWELNQDPQPGRGAGSRDQ